MPLISDLRVKNSEDAEALMRHHLELAALYYEGLSDNYEFKEKSFWSSAKKAWLVAMAELYAEV